MCQVQPKSLIRRDESHIHVLFKLIQVLALLLELLSQDGEPTQRKASVNVSQVTVISHKSNSIHQGSMLPRANLASQLPWRMGNLLFPLLLLHVEVLIGLLALVERVTTPGVSRNGHGMVDVLGRHEAAVLTLRPPLRVSFLQYRQLPSSGPWLRLFAGWKQCYAEQLWTMQGCFGGALSVVVLGNLLRWRTRVSGDWLVGDGCTLWVGGSGLSVLCHCWGGDGHVTYSIFPERLLSSIET